MINCSEHGKIRVNRKRKEGLRKGFGVVVREIEWFVSAVDGYMKLNGMPKVVRTAFREAVRK